MAEIISRLESALDRQYVIGRELGRGGMATVYLAHDRKHDRDVALKVLHPDLAAALGPDRFLREIRIAARLQHPHILPVHDSGEADGLLWFTMPFVDGESLRDRLRRDVQLPVDDAVAITREVAEALHYAHGQSVIHRDIKPENILLSRGHALVADFGIARTVMEATGEGEHGSLTGVGVALGTPTYMSPEQATGGRRLDARSDVYSLGCVLYEMLAGEPPFTGPTPQSLAAKRLTGPVPSVRMLRPQIPPSVDEAIARALAPAAADRFATSAAFAGALGSPAGGVSAPARDASRERSIAVLPFANLSNDPDNEYFADGMTDELINALAKVPGLHVVARTSVFAFKGQQQDIRAIGARLGVRTVLEGSVRRAGARLRLSAQLIGVADGYLLWSETFDRDATDVFAIQDEISRAIAAELKVTLFGGPQTTLVKPPTDDLEAYTLYLKGRQFWNRRTEQDLRRGLECFEQAIALDPQYALAHAGAADSFAILGFYCAMPPTEAFPRARAAAHRALSIEPDLAEAHPALAYVEMYHDWDWVAAEREFQTAIALNPGYSTAHQWYGNFLSVMGRADESRAEFTTAISLDPLSPLKLSALGWSYYFAREFDKAMIECRRAVALDPDFVVSRCWLGLALEGRGDVGEAVAEFEVSARLANRSPTILGFLGHGYASAGRTTEAKRVLESLLEMRTTRYISAVDLGLITLKLGDTDEALRWLEQAERDRAHQMAFLKVDPRLDDLRSTPRFQALLARLHLAP
ncbi:MAG TPA: protein kinase [Gemmatimonadales bacterium]